MFWIASRRRMSQILRPVHTQRFSRATWAPTRSPIAWRRSCGSTSRNSRRGKAHSHRIMRVAITGAAGLFGQGLVAAFSTRHEVVPLTRTDADITNAEAVLAVLERARPELVVPPAGIPDLDICEADPARGFLVNYEGTRNVVEAARRVGAGIAYISTDAVFDGKKLAPYLETDEPRPLTVYGKTKLQAEQAVKTWAKHWIFRVPVLFGPGKTNFVEKGLRKIASGGEYVVGNDQWGCATHTVDAGMKIMEVVE